MTAPAPAATSPAPSLADLTPEQEQAVYEYALALRARLDDVEAVASFGELVFGHVPAAHHRQWIGEILANKRMAATAPPESAKTTWVTLITTAWWIGKHPETSNGICSASDGAAEKMTAAIADTIEKSEKWEMVFPHVKPDKGRGWSSAGYNVRDMRVSETEWAAKRYGEKDATLLGAGVGSSAWNGVRITGIFVLDDMHDRRSKTQQATCDDTVAFFKDTGEYRATKAAHVAIMQTRWNAKDIIAYVKTRPKFKVFEHPAIIDAGTDHERSYWPEQRPLADLKAIQEPAPVEFELVFQGNDKAMEGTVLKTIWLIPYPFIQIDDRWNRYIGMDPAKRVKEIIGKRDDPDSFELAVLVDTGVRLVVEDVFGGVMFAPDAEDLFFNKAAIFKPERSGIETNGLGNEYYVNMLKRMRTRNLNYVLVKVHSPVDLAERLTSVTPYFKSGQMMVSDALTEGLDRFRAQWASFPRGHDDTLSAVHVAWKVASHLLPSESVETIAARAKAYAAAVSPMDAIDRAYFR